MRCSIFTRRAASCAAVLPVMTVPSSSRPQRNPPATSTVSANGCACPPNVAVQVTVQVSSSAVCAGVTVTVTAPVPASVAFEEVTRTVPSARVIV
jgi:hypothetical protein